MSILPPDSNAEAILIQSLKNNGDDPELFDQIEAYYFPLINHGFQLFIKGEHPHDFASSAYTKLQIQKEKIKNRFDINDIIFLDVKKNAYRYSYCSNWNNFYKWIYHLKEIFYQIEKSPEENRAVIKLTFQKKTLSQIATILGIQQNEVHKLYEQAVEQLENNLARIGGKYIFKTFVEDIQKFLSGRYLPR